VNSLRRLGGACAIVLGVSYVLVGITYFLVPDAQRPGMAIESFYPSYAANPLFARLLNWELALGALFAICAVLAIQDAVRSAAEGLARWTGNLAIIGFAVTAIDGFRALSLQPQIAAGYVAADNSAKAAIAATGVTAIDPDGWLAFGAVGAWALATSVLILRTAAFPRVLGYVGIAVGILYGLVVAGNYLGIPQLIAVAAGLGGVVAAPIWFIGLGSTLLRGSAPAMSGMAAARPVSAR
jgi:uncharacterized protein DUF4386